MLCKITLKIKPFLYILFLTKVLIKLFLKNKLDLWEMCYSFVCYLKALTYTWHTIQNIQRTPVKPEI